MSKKTTLDDVLDDDDFGLLESKSQSSQLKTDEERLIDSFKEINIFYDTHNREPSVSNMSEYNLLARLKNFRQNEKQKQILKPFDRHNLLGYVKMQMSSIDEVLNDDDLGLLDTEKDLSIFKYKHTPKPEDRAETDFMAKRKPIKEVDFIPFEVMFHKVHKEIKEGRRQIKPFQNAEKNLEVGQFYVVDGLLLYFKSREEERKNKNLKETTLKRNDGRTEVVFENGTYSNMYYRSLSKSLYQDGKLITSPIEDFDFYANKTSVQDDIQTGWIYVLKSKSNNPKISKIKNLYKIGFSSIPVDERISNAKNEATYLFADVEVVATYKIKNINAHKMENLLHRFFASACLDIDLFNEKKQRLNPREWFVAPLKVIDKVINLIINKSIVNYEYDINSKKIKLK